MLEELAEMINEEFNLEGKDLELAVLIVGAALTDTMATMKASGKTKKQHGGSRPPVRPDDGRLVRKLKNPVRITAILEQYQLDWLDAQGDRQGVLRGLVEGAMIKGSSKLSPFCGFCGTELVDGSCEASFCRK